MVRRRVLLVVVSLMLIGGLLAGFVGCAAQQPGGSPAITAEQPKAATDPAKAAKPAEPAKEAKPAAEPAKEAKPGQPFKIGVIVAMTGVGATGVDMRDGLRLFVDERGGVLAGHPVELIAEDTASDAATTVAKARKLVEKDGVNILYGPIMAHEAYAAAQYATENKVTLWLAIAFSNDLTQRQKSDYLLRTSTAASQTGYPLAEYAYNKLGYKKVAAMGMDFAMGYEVIGGFQERFEDLGGRVTKKLWTPLNALDYGPYLAQVPSDIDAVVAVYGGGDSLRFIPAYKDYGNTAKIPLIGSGIMTDESILDKLGDSVIGAVTSLHYSTALQTPDNQDFVRKFQAKFGRPASYYAENGYSGGMMVEATLKAAGDGFKDPMKFAQAFRQAKVVAPRGPLQADEYNNVIENIYIRKAERVGGKLQNSVIETYSNVSQFGPYNPKDYLAKPPYGKDYPPVKP